MFIPAILYKIARHYMTSKNDHICACQRPIRKNMRADVLTQFFSSLDNSEWMRNGDMSPTRLQCQQEAARVLTQFKLRSHGENAVGLVSMARYFSLSLLFLTTHLSPLVFTHPYFSNVETLCSLTSEERKLQARLAQVDFGVSPLCHW